MFVEVGESGPFWPAQGEKIYVDRKSTRLNSSHQIISYAVFCLKKKETEHTVPHSHHTDDHWAIVYLIGTDGQLPSITDRSTAQQLQHDSHATSRGDWGNVSSSD